MKSEGSSPHSNSCPSSHFLKMHFNIILPFTPTFSKWLFLSCFPTNILYAPLLSPIPARCPVHHILLELTNRVDKPNKIWRGVQFIKLLVTGSSQVPHYLVLIRPKYILRHPILEEPQPLYVPHCDTPQFHTSTKKQTIIKYKNQNVLQ